MGQDCGAELMDKDPQATAREIEQTRDDLARKVDELVDRAKVEAGEAGKKVAVVGAVFVLLLLLGLIAKRRVRS
jgi:hypothetical protein